MTISSVGRGRDPFEINLIAFLIDQLGGSIVLTDDEVHRLQEDGTYSILVSDHPSNGTMTIMSEKSE